MEQLTKAKENFKTLFDKLIDSKKVDKGAEVVAYIFFMAGWDAGFKEGVVA